MRYIALYKGRLPMRDVMASNLYLVPTHGYVSLGGVLAALLYAINHDRVQKGQRPLTAESLDSSTLTKIPKADWAMPGVRCYLCFEITQRKEAP